MSHRIKVTEDNKGFYSIELNGHTKAYGLTKDQAAFYYRGIMMGIEEADNKIILDDSIFDIFH